MFKLNVYFQDHDHDGRLSLEDYITGIKQEPLLIEALGTCLPTRQVSFYQGQVLHILPYLNKKGLNCLF